MHLQNVLLKRPIATSHAISTITTISAEKSRDLLINILFINMVSFHYCYVRVMFIVLNIYDWP